MALFSRRPQRPNATEPHTPEPAAAPEGSAPGVSSPEAPAPEQEVAPHVGISMSSFGGLGPATTETSEPQVVGTVERPSEEAPPAAETIPGLRDNVLLRDALAALTDASDGQKLMNVARQLLQGQVFVRVKGDARALLTEGKDLPLAIATHEGAQFVLVYSSGAALQTAVRADGDVDTSAMAQGVITVLRHVLNGPFDGLIVDHASRPHSAVLPRALVERALEEIDETLTVKSLLVGERTAATAPEIATAMTSAPLWIAVNRASETDAWGVAESRTAEGSRFLEVFSHPLEVIALGRGDQPMPFTPAQLASALAGDTGLDGVIVDPAGPWIRLDRDDLAPIVALTPAP